MASKGLISPANSLRQLGLSSGILRDRLRQYLSPHLSRSIVTETYTPTGNATQSLIYPRSNSDTPYSIDAKVLTTIYSFPKMEPLRFEYYPANHLHLPLRRDILHRAVIYEGDATRQGTASTKWRSDVHGSKRKIRPQKGTGHARLGDKKSPMLRGGGVAFGPKPRDFSTKLPRKMYDLAWRTALSYRYRKGELVVVEDGVEIDYPKTRFVKDIFALNRWGNADGRSLVITGSFRPNLFRALRHAGEDGRALMEREVDVKDLLEMGRIIIEKRALDVILNDHQSDLVPKIKRTTPVA